MLCIYITPFLTLLDPSYSLTTCVQCVAEVFNSCSSWHSNRSVIMESSLFLIGHQCCFERWNSDYVKVMWLMLFIVYCHCWYATWHAGYINVMRVIYYCTPLLIQYMVYRPHKDIGVPSLSLMRCDTQNTSRSRAHFLLVYYYVLSVKSGVATPVRYLLLCDDRWVLASWLWAALNWFVKDFSGRFPLIWRRTVGFHYKISRALCSSRHVGKGFSPFVTRHPEFRMP